MATHAGKEGTAKVGANTIAEIKAWSFNQVAETVDDTSMGDTDRTHLFTLASWDGEMTCHWDETDTNGQGAMTRGASITLNLYPEGASGGDTFFSGTATITAAGVATSLDGMVERTFSFLGNGALTESTV